MSSSSTRNYCVFLSFQGQDRKTFGSHLRSSFDRRGITTLEDEHELRGGEWDPCVFNRTIEDSKVAVVLISENYASSPWCLESLVKILGFQHSGSLAIIPVFYGIDHSDVRKQSGKLREPFLLHERLNPTNVHTWRKALSQLADIPTGHYSEYWKGDAEMIGKITDDIWVMMIGSKSSDLSGLVGMDRHMKAMYTLLNLELKKDDVRRILIWGKGQIGKTELAKYLYEEILHHFDIHIWIDVPRRNHRLDREYDRNFLNDLYYEQREPRPRTLLVIDNVTNHDQAHTIERDRILLGPGSKVIITIKGDLHIDNADFCYEVVGLGFPEALELFCLHAFEQTHPSVGFEELSCRAVKITDCSPLMIKRLGKRLSGGRDRHEWEVIISGYERSLDMGIIDSYDFSLSNHSSCSDMVDVSTQSSTIGNSNDLMGIGRHMEALYRLLELESDNKVRVVSIWGTQGIGKTTLAKYVYEEISQQFHIHVFLENAEDHSSSSGLEDRVISNANQIHAYTIRNSKDGYDVVISGLRRQKVLLIVDDVDNTKALADVWKIASCFGPGSRVIVTTQDESLLLANGVKHIYELKLLRFDEGLQLFYRFAFKQESPSVRFKQLSVRAIKLVGLLPLAIEVTGSMLYRKDEEHWETILQSFEKKQGRGEVVTTWRRWSKTSFRLSSYIPCLSDK